MMTLSKGLALSFMPAFLSVAVAQQFEIGRVDAGKGGANTQTIYLQNAQPLSAIRIEVLNKKGRTGQTGVVVIEQAQAIFEIPGRTDAAEPLDLLGGWNGSEASKTVTLKNQRYPVKAILLGVRRYVDKDSGTAVIQAVASHWHPEPPPPVYNPPQPPVYYPPQPVQPPVPTTPACEVRFITGGTSHPFAFSIEGRHQSNQYDFFNLENEIKRFIQFGSCEIKPRQCVLRSRVYLSYHEFEYAIYADSTLLYATDMKDPSSAFNWYKRMGFCY